jgi:tRNA nucleotidyltransferase (CCA-adding enzyme)
VRPRFTQFNNELTLTPLQQADGMTKSGGVVGCLNRNYYECDSHTDHGLFIGSWGKNTAGRPPRDVDLYFVLPAEVYHRFQRHVWNRQSALLREVKSVIAETYPDTDMSGDGQIVLVRFESYNVEVVPAFPLMNGHYWICDTSNGGRYKETNPWAEVNYT